jgi:cytochrome c biogenesis protein CcmG, thiol:disulfide interchange protein DsbE
MLRRTGRVAAIALVGLFIALLAYGLTTTSTDSSIDQRLGKNRAAPAPRFSLEVLERGTLPPPLARRLSPALADGRLGLGELRGSPFVLNLWASWCTPCREEAPRLQRGWDRLGRSGVVFLGLDMQDIRSDARDFLSEFHLTYPTIRDPGKDVARRYGATGIPETYFVSSRGEVVGHVIGVVSNGQLATGVAAAKTGRPAGARKGGARRTTR